MNLLLEKPPPVGGIDGRGRRWTGRYGSGTARYEKRGTTQASSIVRVYGPVASPLKLPAQTV